MVLCLMRPHANPSSVRDGWQGTYAMSIVECQICHHPCQARGFGFLNVITVAKRIVISLSLFVFMFI
ncbi:hypothetical protein CTA1_10547 [Colletotrichum tanaceti]|uniref:Uncharacterized protein n=1 Tax=Colletotrichum tanaceti TaxID=1306861 RepID=A0A4U6X2F8_9PEZI|nr:hypothetical protein CTA1_10547 [Colletotrichum tanaceti]